ncbi:MAG TPA: HD domain-containing protein, partial [Phycisphaerae bacterium]|nr:HD domain-containing protein [Phycisphaerae bacterium]
MLNHPQISLHRLLLSVSRAVDQVHPSVADHQQRVAYMATSIARQLGIKGADLLDVFQAALLHDIGLITPEIRIAAARLRDLESIAWHSEVGYQLLKTSSLFAGAAAILRDHHVPWGHGAGATKNGRAVPLAAHIITLADKIETSIDRDVPILEQVSSINEQVIAGSGEMFHPECVDAFLEVASR